MKRAAIILLSLAMAFGSSGCTYFIVKSILAAREKGKSQESQQSNNAAKPQEPPENQSRQ